MPFSSQIRDQQTQWCSLVTTTDRWIPQKSTIYAGEAGGHVVTNGTLHAYLKPIRKDGPDSPRAAFEKIAADLAGELDLCVPPVLLFDRPVKSSHEEKKCALSLICFPRVITFHQLQFAWNSLTPDIQSSIAIAIAESSGMIAFDMFVDQFDRKNPGNILYGYSTNVEQGKVMFIDFAWSMNYKYRWAQNKWSAINPLVLPPLYSKHIDNPRVTQVASDIEALPEKVIEKVVSRIDNSWLMNALRKDLIEGLIQRRNIVAEHVRSTYTVNSKVKP